MRMAWFGLAGLGVLPGLRAAPQTKCNFRDVAAPSASLIYVLCEDAGILASTDAGRNWTSYSTGKEKPLLAVAFMDANRGLIAGENGVLLATEDGGKHWQPRDTKTTHILRAISAVGESVWVAGDEGIILHSADGGRTWKQQPTGLNLGLQDIYFADAQHGWAVGWIGLILRTSNGGEKWEQVQTAAASWSLSSVYFRDASNGWAVGFDGQILYSHDGGATWERQKSPVQVWLTSIRFEPSGQGWITTRDGFLTTTDDGKNWQAVPGPVNSFPNRLVSVNGKLWAIGTVGVLEHPRGQNWTVIPNLVENSSLLSQQGTPAADGQAAK